MESWKPIAGETPLDDLSGLKLSGIRSRKALNEAEAENIRRAVLKYLAAPPTARQAPFDVRWMLKLHREMFGRVWKWAGEIRRVQLNIGVPAAHVENALHLLQDDLRHWKKVGAVSLLDQSVLLHHRAVHIHPFLNGNGRWARMLANIWLYREGGRPTLWPEATVGDESAIRREYLTAIRAADGGDFSLLRGLHERFSSI